MNPYSAEERLQAMFSCCYAAVQTGFPHLAVRHIITPPIEWFDAKLARQMAIYILNKEFEVPRRRIVTMQERRRTNIGDSIRVVTTRMEDEVFAANMERLCALAKDLFLFEVRKAAA